MNLRVNIRRLAAPLAWPLAMLMLVPGTAHGEDRPFCASRPGLGSPPCTASPGGIVVESGLAGWDHSASPDAIADAVTMGSTTVRLGLDARTELQVGYAGWVHERLRDRASGVVSRVAGSGDAMVGFRRGLAGPNGPVAIQAYVTLPVGQGPGTAGDWGAGVLLPVALDLPKGFSLGFTPHVDALVNGSGTGRHLAYGAVAGLGHDLMPGLSTTLELAALRDEDPDEPATDARLAASVAWRIKSDFQIDLEVDHGLASGAPDRSIVFGLAWRLR